MTSDFILEIGTEELPASAIDSAMSQLKEIGIELMAGLELGHGEIRSYGTPRRLVLSIRDLDIDQPDRKLEAKGPSAQAAYAPDGAPTQAAQGFAKSQGVNVDDLEIRESDQGRYVYASRFVPGRPTSELLAEALPGVITAIDFEKSMRWGNRDIRFSRPIRWLLALLGDSSVHFSIEDIVSGNLTYGHRFLADNPMLVDSAEEYGQAMVKGRVVFDQVLRRELIVKLVNDAASEQNASAVIHGKVFDEVVNLVESPGAVCGTFADGFLELPREVLETAMESHQRYFPIEDANGNLAAGFVAVHNSDPENAEMIRRGNERVLRARLADAKFFFDEDLAKPLADKIELLKNVVFQEKLGTLYDKACRVKSLSSALTQMLGMEQIKPAVERAAMLLKADLVSNMVIEFPDLQGIMGREYAARAGEPKEVADAISEHYLPRFSGDILPPSEVGAIVSIADKIDTIAGCLTIGLIPSGSEDPYMLRRFSRGILEIVRAKQMRLSLLDMFDHAAALLVDAGVVAVTNEPRAEFTDFLSGRIRQYLLGEGFSYDTVDAVLSQSWEDIVDVINRTEAVDIFRAKEDMASLLVGFNRCKNLSKDASLQAIETALFAEREERILYEDLSRTNIQLDEHLENEDYAMAMRDLASLRSVIDNFFDRILVMTEDEAIKRNRVDLLHYAVKTFDRVADFSKIVISGS